MRWFSSSRQIGCNARVSRAPRFCWAWLGLVLAVLWIAGCSGSGEPPKLQPHDISEFGKLSGAKQSTNPALREAITLVESEAGTPEQLRAEHPIDPERGLRVECVGAEAMQECVTIVGRLPRRGDY